MPQTIYYDQLVKLLDRWSYTGLLSFAAYEIQTRVSMGEDIHFLVKRTDMHYLYETRQQLRDCLTKLSEEVDDNLFAMSRDQHDISYLSKLATTYNQLMDYLSNGYQRQLTRFEGVTFDIEPPKKPVIGEWRDDMGAFQGSIMEELNDPYWNDYVLEEQFVIEDDDVTPIPVKLIKMIAEGFSMVAEILNQKIRECSLNCVSRV